MKTPFRSRLLPVLSLAVAGVLALSSRSAAAQESEQFVVIKAGRVITVSGEEIENGEIILVDGKVRLVGKGLEYPKTALVIEARDQTVMPGFVHPRTTFGTPAISRNGVNGDFRAMDDFYLTELRHEDLLKNGFTTVALYPPGATIPGLATIARTGGPLDTRIVKEGSYLSITMTSMARDKAALRGAFQQARAEIEKVRKAKEDFDKKQQEEAAARRNQPAQPQGGGQGGGQGGNAPATPPATPPAEQKPAEFTPPAINPKVKPLVDLLEKKAAVPPLIEVSSAGGVLHVWDVLKGFEEPARVLVLSGASDYNAVAEQIGEREKLVVASAVMHRLPDTVVRYNLVADLLERGVEVAIMPPSESAAVFERYRQIIADLMRSGVKREEALRGVTLSPAKVIGQSARIGSIERGKDGDLVFFDGDPLDPRSKVVRVMIHGETVWEAGK